MKVLKGKECCPSDAGYMLIDYKTLNEKLGEHESNDHSDCYWNIQLDDGTECSIASFNETEIGRRTVKVNFKDVKAWVITVAGECFKEINGIIKSISEIFPNNFVVEDRPQGHVMLMKSDITEDEKSLKYLIELDFELMKLYGIEDDDDLKNCTLEEYSVDIKNIITAVKKVRSVKFGKLFYTKM